MDDNTMISVYGHAEYRLVQALLADMNMLPFHADLRQLIPSMRDVREFQWAFTLACHHREKGPIYYKTAMAIVHRWPDLIRNIVHTMTTENVLDVLHSKISYNIYTYLCRDTNMYNNKDALCRDIHGWLQRCLRK